MLFSYFSGIFSLLSIRVGNLFFSKLSKIYNTDTVTVAMHSFWQENFLVLTSGCDTYPQKFFFQSHLLHSLLFSSLIICNLSSVLNSFYKFIHSFFFGQSGPLQIYSTIFSSVWFLPANFSHSFFFGNMTTLKKNSRLIFTIQLNRPGKTVYRHLPQPAKHILPND